MSDAYKHALLIVSSSDPILISDNKICSVLVQLVFAKLYIINFLELYSPRVVDGDAVDGRFSK